MKEIKQVAALLESYKSTKVRISIAKEQISSLEYLVKYIDEPRYFGSQRLKPKKMPEKASLERMLDRLYETIDSLSELLQVCETLISSVPVPECASVLRYYYISGLTMEQVARKVTYSRTHCWRLWRKGLEMISDEWEGQLSSDGLIISESKKEMA